MNANLFCNLADCRLPVTETGWATRCLHVFCQEHGANFFANNLSRVQCPICSEENAKETDVLLCDGNQSDMLLGGLSPEKCLALLAKSIKLWKYQTGADKKFDSIKNQHLQNKLEEMKRHCDSLLNESRITHAKELANLKTSYQEILMQLKQVASELEMAKIALKQSQAARRGVGGEFSFPGFSPDVQSRAQNNYSPSLFSSRFGF